MLTSFRILSLTWFAVSVLGQDCVDVTLDCNQPVPTIYKLGDASCACNRPEHAGALKYDSGKVHVCLGSEWKAIQFEERYGSETNPGYSCKDILNKAGTQLNDGVYWIRLPGVSLRDAFPVYCDMAAGGWTLVFKIVSGVNKKVWDLYNSDLTSAEFITAALDVTKEHPDHYKNRVIMNWSSFNASQARVSLYEGGISKKYLLFNAAGTDKLNWFSFNKMTSSSWSDISSEPRNYFTIQGDCHADDGLCRSFFISRSYAGCGSDLGWLVGSTSNKWCSWENSAAHKFNVLYSKLSTYTNWNTVANVGVADVLAVFLK